MLERIRRGDLSSISILLIGTVLATSSIAACGTTQPENPGAAALDEAGVPTRDDLFADGGASQQAPFDIVPANPVLTASGAPMTQQFSAVMKGTQTPVAVAWSSDLASVGLIDASSGLFTANGTVGGLVNISATANNRTATTTLTVKVSLRDDNGVSAQDQADLRAGGPASNDGAFKWLYPYDKTVFPRGLRSPLLQFGGNSPDVVFVHAESKYLSYDGFFGASNPGRVTLDEARWRSLTQSAGGSDKLTVTVTKKSGGVVTGPIAETWTIAPASLKGTVYYNTYNTPQAQGAGALLKVRPGSTVDAQVFLGGCAVCHSVSANGAVIATGVGWQDGDPTKSGTYMVDGMGNVPRDPQGDAIPTYSEDRGRFSFGALTPDGKYLLSHSNQQGGVRGLSARSGPASALYDTANGTQVTVNGWTSDQAQMPSFSPDGKHVVFNDRSANPSGKVLTVYDFDQATLTFSNQRVAWSDPKLVAWPAFLPDSQSIIFHVGNDFGTQGHDPSDIAFVDVPTQKRYELPALNGYEGTDTNVGNSYLPFGDPAEGHLNYEPTVLPVAAGGYYWVMFTSRRCYGNTFTDAQDAWGNTPGAAELSPRKKLWVAAIDLNATPGQDRSHPAFYLPGQETDTGNMRAFWALDPCHNDGEGCESGDECCGGFCRQTSGPDGKPTYACTSQGPGCATEFERCTTASDCCGSNAGYQCINGHCAAPAPK